MIKPVNASQIHNTYVPKLCGIAWMALPKLTGTPVAVR